MKVLIDACVLYPTVMREMVMGAAKADLFTPLWSARILEEWARAVARNIPEDAGIARAEIAMLQAGWPKAEIFPNQGDMMRLVLPDPDDVHVLAAAIAGSADILLTLNAKDFPRHSLAEEGLSRQDPDAFLTALTRENPEAMGRVGEDVRATAQRLSGQPQTVKMLLKKARLPRLAKALVALQA